MQKQIVHGTEEEEEEALFVEKEHMRSCTNYKHQLVISALVL
jgi:hypothetical protein